MSTIICELFLLFKKYNIFLIESRSLENSIDDQTVPYFEQEFKITRLRELTDGINETIKQIKELGYIPSEKELANGFKGQED